MMKRAAIKGAVAALALAVSGQVVSAQPAQAETWHWVTLSTNWGCPIAYSWLVERHLGEGYTNFRCYRPRGVLSEPYSFQGLAQY